MVISTTTPRHPSPIFVFLAELRQQIDQRGISRGLIASWRSMTRNASRDVLFGIVRDYHNGVCVRNPHEAHMLVPLKKIVLPPPRFGPGQDESVFHETMRWDAFHGDFHHNAQASEPHLGHLEETPVLFPRQLDGTEPRSDEFQPRNVMVNWGD